MKERVKEFSFKDRIESFRYAFNGVKQFLELEHNARIHLFATGVLIFCIWLFQPSRGEIVALVLATGFVWAAEIFNTAVEKIMDFIEPAQNPKVKIIKDISAAAVLVAASAAFLTGIIIFIPKLF
jgi:diacylglycerol kinase (ATP)